MLWKLEGSLEFILVLKVCVRDRIIVCWVTSSFLAWHCSRGKCWLSNRGKFGRKSLFKANGYAEGWRTDPHVHAASECFAEFWLNFLRSQGRLMGSIVCILLLQHGHLNPTLLFLCQESSADGGRCSSTRPGPQCPNPATTFSHHCPSTGDNIHF